VKAKSLKRNIILGILFFLPVVFLLFLYPSTHNYDTLAIVDENVIDIPSLYSDNRDGYQFKGRLTVLGFLGANPVDKSIMVLNLKEMIYDKFKGFKGFQVIFLVSQGTEEQVATLKKELYQYDDLKYWHFVYLSNDEISKIFNSLSSSEDLDPNYASDNVYIIDKDLNQRGRIDDRSDNEKKRGANVYGLTSYNGIEIAELKNKMGDDMRILFTEYRQKRKGNFDSSVRRAEDLKTYEKE
jgi:hypothetical protein